jgi:hypothetical protein
MWPLEWGWASDVRGTWMSVSYIASAAAHVQCSQHGPCGSGTTYGRHIGYWATLEKTPIWGAWLATPFCLGRPIAL